MILLGYSYHYNVSKRQGNARNENTLFLSTIVLNLTQLQPSLEQIIMRQHSLRQIIKINLPPFVA
jgi:hypothetical protein